MRRRLADLTNLISRSVWGHGWYDVHVCTISRLVDLEVLHGTVHLWAGLPLVPYFWTWSNWSSVKCEGIFPASSQRLKGAASHILSFSSRSASAYSPYRDPARHVYLREGFDISIFHQYQWTLIGFPVIDGQKAVGCTITQATLIDLVKNDPVTELFCQWLHAPRCLDQSAASTNSLRGFIWLGKAFKHLRKFSPNISIYLISRIDQDISHCGWPRLFQTLTNDSTVDLQPSREDRGHWSDRVFNWSMAGRDRSAAIKGCFPWPICWGHFPAKAVLPALEDRPSYGWNLWDLIIPAVSEPKMLVDIGHQWLSVGQGLLPDD